MILGFPVIVNLRRVMSYKDAGDLVSKIKGLYVILDDQFLKGRNMVDLAYR